MLPTWLIEAGVYGPEADPLLAEIRRQGMAAELVPHRALKPGAAVVVGGRQLADRDCVIGHGTFPFAAQIKVHRRWVPGAWCNTVNFDCVSVLAHFGKFALNQHYTILPGVEAIRQADWLFSIFGRDNRVFARPTGCDKRFTGRRIERDSFESALSPVRYDPTTLVLVAAPRSVGREWRLLVVGDRIVTGSRYATDGNRDIAPGCPAEVLAQAEAMLASVRWRPDPIFYLDVAESAGQLWVVELSAFSTSWLYGCDLAIVVAEASTLATRLHTGG
jgi:hypothetical protein